jgi:hypothetical protein
MVFYEEETMGARKTAEERFFPRYISVTSQFTGKLFRPMGAALDCRVVDVSRDGLGVISETIVNKGETIELHTLERVIQFQVAYCMDDLIHHGKFRWGLRRVGSQENLVSLFAANGFIDKREA